MTVCIATVGADISQRPECSRWVIKDILRCGSDVCFPQESGRPRPRRRLNTGNHRRRRRRCFVQPVEAKRRGAFA
jgi:hypothetical protein